MATILLEWTNPHTVATLLCPFVLHRTIRPNPKAEPPWGIEAPCQVCIVPLNLCSGVDTDRIYLRDGNGEDWTLTLPEGFEGVVSGLAADAVELIWDPEAEDCLWIAEERTASGSGVAVSVTEELEIDEDTEIAGKVVMVLSITISITGAVTASKTVAYTLNNVDPDDVGPWELAGPDLSGRTLTIGGGYSIVFPATVDVELQL